MMNDVWITNDLTLTNATVFCGCDACVTMWNVEATNLRYFV